MNRKVKFSLSIEKLQIDFEGNQELGQDIQHGVQQAISRLMSTQARLLSSHGQPANSETSNTETLAPEKVGQATTNGNGNAKQPRQRRSSGVSLKRLLRGLKAERFFSQPRSCAEAESKLKDKGHTFPTSTVAARLQDLTKKDELHRSATGPDGTYLYKDTPFDEAHRGANACSESAN